MIDLFANASPEFYRGAWAGVVALFVAQALLTCVVAAFVHASRPREAKVREWHAPDGSFRPDPVREGRTLADVAGEVHADALREKQLRESAVDLSTPTLVERAAREVHAKAAERASAPGAVAHVDSKGGVHYAHPDAAERAAARQARAPAAPPRRPARADRRKRAR